MTDDEAKEAAERVICFLETCDNGDVRAGVGAVLGLGSDQQIEMFKSGIAAAIMGRRPLTSG